MSVQLCPCPFCGSPATATNGPTWFTASGHSGWCVVCPCCSVGTGAYGSKEQAAERWNKRADTHAAEVAMLTAERESALNDLVTMTKAAQEVSAEVIALREEVARLRGALEKYGTHIGGVCDVLVGSAYCSCGFDTALAPAARKEDERG